MGDVIRLPNAVSPCAYARKVLGVDLANGPDWTVVVEMDLDTKGWMWKAHTYVAYSEAIEDGSVAKVLATLQQEPAVLYDSAEEAHESAVQAVITHGSHLTSPR